VKVKTYKPTFWSILILLPLLIIWGCGNSPDLTAPDEPISYQSQAGTLEQVTSYSQNYNQPTLLASQQESGVMAAPGHAHHGGDDSGHDDDDGNVGCVNNGNVGEMSGDQGDDGGNDGDETGQQTELE
jgi:hypothetical protein